jgi:heme a synthase
VNRELSIVNKMYRSDYLYAMQGTRASRAVGIWLMIGVGMIVIQVILGGITRLTESGLSITEWKPLTGALPPLNDTQWIAEFDKYKNTDQFRYVHADFKLSDFKFIFFWEWFHRLWARMLGVVFLIGFFYFLVRKHFKKEMVIPMIILFLLGAMQGAVGWIMVQSGLVPEKMFVGHIELTTHFIAALILLCYTFWFALGLLVDKKNIVEDRSMHRLTVFIVAILFIQLIYGGFMAGLKAATAAPTWPDINGAFIPTGMDTLSQWWKNLTDNKIAVQLIHRSLAYLLLIMMIAWWVKSNGIRISELFNRWKSIPLVLVAIQVLLGILTVLNSPYSNRLVWFGIAHQFVGMLLLLSIILMLFMLRSKKVVT